MESTSMGLGHTAKLSQSPRGEGGLEQQVERGGHDQRKYISTLTLPSRIPKTWLPSSSSSLGSLVIIFEYHHPRTNDLALPTVSHRISLPIFHRSSAVQWLWQAYTGA
ncbi:hypothetical protein PAXRUDRAFT_460189 [Paxillus rubicundulus Ve08.2h10]|uniref:Uncharacterized protein n=1 Tax=Paxillus rubicundulus Ve08.2h10 TaxID=930991 RepID=A0A0D0DWI1_9AGAM|nr:hypothetical protein PAXRUDRAFT_460189 [Paxillus rubicundulus Ve08.2h10]